MSNKPMCTICARNPATYSTRDVCHQCADKIAKVYYTMKKNNKPMPVGSPNIQNIHKADKLFENVQDIPINIEDAKYTNSLYWLHWDACSQAGHIGVKTLSGECWFCEQGDDQLKLHVTPRQAAIAAGETYYNPENPCGYCGTIAPKRVDNGRCKGCDDARRNGTHTQAHKSPRQAAIAAGDNWYMPDKSCALCGTLSLRHTNNGRCKGCDDLRRNKAARPKSPRQAAIAAGEMWYMPETPCPHCDTLSLRHTNNGRCQGCQPIKRTTRPSAHVNTLPADTIISRDDAKLLEMRYYRTGKYCREGHNGFRLTSTGACVDCMQ